MWFIPWLLEKRTSRIMKIHIDTADEKEKAQAKKIADKPAKPAQAKQSSQPSAKPKPAPKPNLPKSPPKEPKAPSDVVAARKRQTSVLQARQKRELLGKNDAVREQAGVGFWPSGSPFL